jgi:hypothetical protein
MCIEKGNNEGNVEAGWERKREATYEVYKNELKKKIT